MTEGHGLVGTTIAGKYRIRRLVGVGGMGAVYEGQHVDLAKRVAVKIIDSAAIMSAELTTRFKREARAASAVESEHIVQVFDVGRDPEVGLYMVMEFLQGEDLEMRLRKQPGRRLDPVIVAQIGHQVARALVKAHAARVVHRDLKPANIFLTQREDGSLRVKVLDFGISKLLASEASMASKDGMLNLTQAGVALGTPQYMSPEQAQGLTTVDHRTDVWGLGVVIYEALAGVPAYPELKSYQETIMKILAERPPPLTKVAPWVSPELAKVVHDAIEHDVTKRIPDCATLAARLAQAVPEAVMGSTGPFQAMQALARSGSGPIIAPALRPLPAPAIVEATTSGPITLGDDTQVVVRPSDPEQESSSSFDDPNPSATMVASETTSTRRDPPKIVVRDPGAPQSGPSSVMVASEDGTSAPRATWSTTDEAPMSTGDPTMFQQPAWVAPGDGPTTMKSVVASDARSGATTLSTPRSGQGIVAAAVTALLVIGVGVGVLALMRRTSPTSTGAGASGNESPSAAVTSSATTNATTVETQPPVAETIDNAPPAAPPATGTGAGPAPMAPATGAPATSAAFAATVAHAASAAAVDASGGDHAERDASH